MSFPTLTAVSLKAADARAGAEGAKGTLKRGFPVRTRPRATQARGRD